ncbi:MAG: sugar phosphate isomerase/epimerase [Clostridia bacterium]|nr:sugar phosphate isomerase/epimerase [Clostridia bacterium]
MREYGIQLYSVRDAMKEDVRGTLKKIADMGYTSVEFAGFFGHSAEEIRGMLEETGLRISGTHSSFEDLRPSKIAETLAYHRAIKNTDYIVPGADLSTLEKVEDFCRVMNFAQPILAAEGIRLGYHNHSHEFAVQPYGTTVHAQLERRLSVHFEIDTFWAFNAGCDPVAVMERLSERIHVIHVKDGFLGGKGMPLGQGEAPVRAVVDYAVKNGIQMVVESETLSPSGLAEAEACIAYLRSIE